jgi:hypothetical protein
MEKESNNDKIETLRILEKIYGEMMVPKDPIHPDWTYLVKVHDKYLELQERIIALGEEIDKDVQKKYLNYANVINFNSIDFTKK